MSSPLSFGCGLTGYPVSRPPKLSILRAKPKESTLWYKTCPAGWWIIIIILKHVSEGCEDLLVTITVAMSDNLHASTIRIDPPGESGDPNMSIITGLTGKSGWIIVPVYLRTSFIVIKTPHIKSPSIPVSNLSPTIPLVKIKLTIRSAYHRMSGMIMIAPYKTGQENFSGISLIKNQVTIQIGIF